MKKISILALALTAGISAVAQEAVVKEAEKAMKNGKPYAEVMTLIEPATKDASTAQQAITYFVPGKAAFKEYDDYLGKRSLGMYKADDPKTPEIFHTMAKDLVGGYDNFMKALSLDTVVDAKGKTKTKYSKEIVNILVAHHNDYNTAALDFWQAKDYKGAYKAWDIYLNMNDIPALAEKIKMPADTIVGEIMYNQALAAWQANDMAGAVSAFKNAVNKGFSKKDVFTYGAAVADGAKDYDNLLFFASKGNELFGNEDQNFINLIINYYLKTEKYDEAVDYLKKAIVASPNVAQYYALLGIIYDNKKEKDAALETYKKALELDSENGLANFYYGRGLAAKAGEMQDNYNGKNYDEYKNQTLVPIYKDSLKYLEKAYDVDKNNRSEILKVLEIVYYNLADEAGMESVNQRKLED